MKKTINFCVWLLLCYASISLACADEQNYNRLLNRNQFSQTDASVISHVQRKLGIIYQHDLKWQDDLRRRSHPLTDGLMGPVTLFWLQQFVIDFKIDPRGKSVDQLIRARLKDIAMFTSKYPEKTRVLLSADFAHWNDAQPPRLRDRNYAVRRSGSEIEMLILVKRYQQKDLPPDTPTAAYYYQLTADDFKILQGKEQILNQLAKKQILNQLAKLENIYYENLALLEEAISQQFQAYPALYEQLSPAIKRYYATHDLVITSALIEFVAREKKDDLLLAPLNKVIASLLEKGLSEVIYPDQALFHKAAQDKIHAGIGVCYPAGAHNPYISTLKLNNAELRQLADDLKDSSLSQSLEEIVEWSTEYQDQRCNENMQNNESMQKKVDTFVRKLYETMVKPGIVLLYKKQPVLKAAPSIQWSGDNCGCVLDNLAGTVYGFYPFWMADDKKQNINFSVLSRIAYYGLSFDREGTLLHMNDPDNHAREMASGNLNDMQKQFIKEARRHNSKVDWVIYNDKSYWERWEGLTYKARERVFKILADNIARLLTRPLSGHFPGSWQGLSPDRTQGDGVTLDFRNYPRNEESIDLLIYLYDTVKKKLDAASGEYVINLVVLQSEMSGDIRHFTSLVERITNAHANGHVPYEADPTIDTHTNGYSRLNDMTYARARAKGKILVLLDEPTATAKKKLRQYGESGTFHGEERIQLLRHIIPVMTFDRRNWAQLEDDLAYFRDNFGGVGFWPLTVNEKPPITAEMAWRCDDIKTIGGCLVRHFQFAWQMGQPDSFIDRFVCANRFAFWSALVVLVGLSLFLLSIYLFSCRQRRKYKHYYISGIFATAIPALIIMLLLLLYDPVLESYSEGNIPLIVVISGIIFVSLVLYQRKRKRTRKPARPRMGTPA